MTDQWVPGPPPAPAPPIAGLPPANSWNPVPGCSPSPDAPSIVASIIITNVPATIVAPYAWGITLNDGQNPPNFTIDHFDSTGALIESPIFIDGVSGDVMVTHDPTLPLGVATKDYVDTHSAGVTEAPEDGQLYGRSNADWVVIPEPTVPEAPNDGVAYVRQSLNWTPLSAQLTGYMPISGGTFTGPVYFPANNSVIVAGAAGTTRAILGATMVGAAAVGRWQMQLGDATAESGSNAGSNFALTAIGDTGSILSTPLTVNRASGAITVNTGGGIVPVTINGPAGSWRSIAGTTNGSMRWQMYLGNPTGELGSNFGSNFQLNSYSDAGTVLATPLQIARQTGVATFSQIPSFPGGANGQVLTTNGAGGLSWNPIPPSGVPEAPTDGQQYARQNAGWTPFVSGPPTTISDTAPSSPQVGQLWWDSVGGQLYVWYQDANTSQWVVAVNAASRPPPASTTVLGSVKVDGTSIRAASDGTISTVLVPMGDNRIINGNFAINQRGYASGTALAAAAYGHDRWKAGASGCTYTFTAAVPDTTITITAGTLTQVIEAGMIEGGVYTLSWTGTAQARVYQGTPTGAYAASPVVTASLTAGTNTIVEFNAGTVVRAKLEIGSTATPFNRQTMAKSLADCQRYYQQFYMLRNQYATAAAAYNMNSLQLCPPMRATPTSTIPGIAVSNCTFNSVNSSYPDNVIINVTATAAGVVMIVNGIVMVSAEL